MLSKSSGCQLVAVVLCLGLYHLALDLTGSDNACLCRALILGFVFIAAAFIDMATYTLPNLLTLGGAVLGLLLPGGDFIDSAKGGLAAATIMGSIAAISRGGIGGGDIKLALAMGTFLGWPLVVPALGLSFCFGGSMGLILILARVKKRTDPIPFGPFLALGTLVARLWGQELVKWYLTVMWKRL